jgi:glucose uptake protein GlcU
VWNLGNICSVYANAAISFAVAQPLMQCALLISGILGIFVFKEIKGVKRIVTFFAFAGVLLGGAVLLALFGPKG